MDIKRYLSSEVDGRWSPLSPVYGPTPFWIEAPLGDLVGKFCQTLYVIREDLGPAFTLGVVRTPEADYPMVFCMVHLLTVNAHLITAKAGSYPTFVEGMIAVDPTLANIHGPTTMTTYTINADPHEEGDQRTSRSREIPIITFGECMSSV